MVCFLVHLYLGSVLRSAILPGKRFRAKQGKMRHVIFLIYAGKFRDKFLLILKSAQLHLNLAFISVNVIIPSTDL